ncbi:MAG TPA: carbohydrate ABC transporter permease [Clostridia bacterium]
MDTIKRAAGKSIKVIVLIWVVLMSLFPVYWTLVNSFRDNTQILSVFALFPEQTKLTNYINVFLQSTIIRSFTNSLTIVVCDLVLLSILSLMASFAISRYKFKLGFPIYLLFAAGIFIPGITLMGMIYKLLYQLSLLGTKPGVILLYASTSLPLSIFLLVAFMQTIPKEIDDAAIIDGCNPWQLFTKIIIPLSRNGLVVVLIIAFIGAWNDYIWAMILLPTQLERTFTVALAFFKTEFFTDYGLLSACVIVGLLPVIVGYVFLQDKLIIGLTAASLKG